jgi:acid phosphatase
MQEAFWGLYPAETRTASFPPPTIVTRAPQDETLYPNDGNCRRFAQLSRAFAQRAADRWNDTPEMSYLTKKIGKWMPDPSKGVAVDSRPRLSGIMDTINSTLAHGAETRLPSEFYDEKLRKTIENIGVEEWFAGYGESAEYRALGIGGLMGDIVERMVGSVESNGNDGLFEVGGGDSAPILSGRGGEKEIKMGLSGCHDTTLAAILASLGAFNGEPWPPYTSHIAIELFRKAEMPRLQAPPEEQIRKHDGISRSPKPITQQTAGWFGWFKKSSETTPTNLEDKQVGIARRKIEELSDEEKLKLNGYYVRLRYNDKPVTIPGCALPGNHLDGDESFCTLVGSPRSMFISLADTPIRRPSRR